MDRTRDEVLGYIDDFVEGKGGDWDDFMSIRIGDPELDRIRLLCSSMRDIYPPSGEKAFCSPEGMEELRRIADSLRRGGS